MIKTFILASFGLLLVTCSSSTFDEGTIIKIKLKKSRVIDKKGIGNEWSFESSADSKIYLKTVR